MFEEEGLSPLISHTFKKLCSVPLSSPPQHHWDRGHIFGTFIFQISKEITTNDKSDLQYQQRVVVWGVPKYGHGGVRPLNLAKSISL